MRKFSVAIVLFFSLLLIHSAHASSRALELAKKNFDEMCFRALPEVVLDTTTVQNHAFKLLERDRFIYGLETAKLPQQQSIRIKNQGCESYTWQIDLVLNAKAIEQQNKFCDACLIQQLNSLSALFRLEDREFYVNSLTPLAKVVQQHKKLEIDTEYHLEPLSDMPHIAAILALKKLKQQQYKVSLLFFVGPL